MKSFSSWINIEYKSYYLDSKNRGLRLFVNHDVDENGVERVRSFLRFLKKRYFFPVRCRIHLTNDERYKSSGKGFCNGIFYPGQEKPRRYPSIFLPLRRSESEEDWSWRLFSLACLLTYYYQWYFELENDFSHRSLEREATEMAEDLVGQYLDCFTDN